MLPLPYITQGNYGKPYALKSYRPLHTWLYPLSHMICLALSMRTLTRQWPLPSAAPSSTTWGSVKLACMALCDEASSLLLAVGNNTFFQENCSLCSHFVSLWMKITVQLTLVPSSTPLQPQSGISCVLNTHAPWSRFLSFHFLCLEHSCHS